MRRSIGKLDSSKHLLDEVGASDASNRGKSVSWVHSSACERSIGNASPSAYILRRFKRRDGADYTEFVYSILLPEFCRREHEVWLGFR